MESVLERAKYIEPDCIMKTSLQFQLDESKEKVNLSIGVCCNDSGKLHIFDSVLLADKKVSEKYREKPYILSNGSKDYSLLTQELAFGKNSEYIKAKRICTIQTIGGTGAIFIILDYLRRFEIKSVYVTQSPYLNHTSMIQGFGYEVKYLHYYDNNKLGIDYELFLRDLREIPCNSCLLLQVCCYNPCSTDIDESYFDEIAKIIKEKRHIIILDLAYQGLSSSNLEKDVALIRKFESYGISFAVCQSFSKIMSLYGERAGALHIVCKDKEHRRLIFNNLSVLIRKYYTSPTIHTNRIVCELLKDEHLRKQWTEELHDLSERIKQKRNLLFDTLQTVQTKYQLNYDWSPFKNQRGIFSFVPFLNSIFEKLQMHHIYIIDNGRINVSSITKKNVHFISDKICVCLREANPNKN